MALVVMIIAAPCFADIYAGGQARYLAMGGAGLAAVDTPDVTTSVNPAAIGIIPTTTRVIFFPSGSFRADNASTKDLFNWALDIPNLSPIESLELAQDFGGFPTMFDYEASVGFGRGGLGITFNGEARARVTPNDPFMQWARGEAAPDASMEANVHSEAAGSLPIVTLAIPVSQLSKDAGQLWIGGRLRYVNGRYTNRTVTWNGLSLQVSTEPVERSTGIAGDIGVIYLLPKLPKTSVGLVVTNLLKPSLDSIEQDMIVSIGAVTKPTSQLTIAADLVNLTKAYNEGAKLRMGIEIAPTKDYAVRFGYSGQSFTWGGRVFGIDVAFSSRMPLGINRTIRF